MTTPQGVPSAENQAAGRRDLRLILFVLIGLCMLFVVGYAQRLAQKEAVDAALVAQQQKIETAQQHQAELEDSVQAMGDPAVIERAARNDLGMIRPGDQPIVLLDPPAAAAATPLPATAPVRDAPGNWQLWLDLLWGKGTE